MAHPVVRRRREERSAQLARAEQWASALASRLSVHAVVVVGSYARGDFNKWSDVDVLVVADDLPADGRRRLELLHAGAPPGLQPVGWSPGEWGERLARGDPMAREAARDGVVVHGRLPQGPATALDPDGAGDLS
ncbi:nucleotidyltransferase domain-containing protein [Egibacter rhizosphaerae]|uniref:nucleotidyltransferase domain-containing protein n=1 Tax=Egibacter rhizosphaerae TaxID=1670831 RepID=UPI0013F15D6D|nr:nucleotidyltransferase domain-containing protein [Egibacter rhizosphaerae]